MGKMDKSEDFYRKAEKSVDSNGCVEDALNVDDKDQVVLESSSRLIYPLTDIPPVPVLITSALQHCMLALPGALTMSSLVADAACFPYNHPVRVEIFCATLFMSGISTIMQTGLGIRLPIFQGSSASFIVPILSFTRDAICETMETVVHGGSSNITNATTEKDYHGINEAKMYAKLQMMSGSLMVASLLEILVGGLGIFRLLSSFIGPITIATTITLIGITLCKLPIIYGRPSFSITFGCACLGLLFLLYLQHVRIPLPRCTKEQKKRPRKYFPIFLLLPIMCTIVVMWILIWVLTVCNVFTEDKTNPQFLARADARIDLIHHTPWFRLSYPGMFGPPKINWAFTTSYMVAFFASITESIGDYYTVSKVCEVGPPPHQAISRGLFTEGVASLLSGAMGVGHATTSFSTNIGALTITKTASKSVLYMAGAIFITISLVGKLGAAMTTVPNPVLGGVAVVIVGPLVSLGLSNLKRVDMAMTRNLIVVGVSLLSAFVLPQMIQTYPEIFATGREDLDQMVNALLGTPMFVGAVVSTLLDNTAPGSRKSRGMSDDTQADQEAMTSHMIQSTNSDLIYSWKCYPRVIKFIPFLRYVPFLPK